MITSNGPFSERNRKPDNYGVIQSSAQCSLYLSQYKNKIISRYEIEVRAKIPASEGRDSKTIIDSLPDFLDELISALNEGNVISEVCSNIKISKEHGLQRAGLPKYTLEQVLFEYAILRRILLTILRSHTAITIEESDVIHEFIQEGMIQSGAAFSEVHAKFEAKAAKTAQALRDTENALQKTKNEAAETLQKSYDTIKEMTDSLPVLFWWTGEGGQENHFNKKWFEYTGIAPNDNPSRGNDFFQFIHPDDIQNNVSARATALKTKSSVKFEERVRGKDGSYRWHLVNATPIFDETGKFIRWFATSTDIHEQKKVSEDLLKVQSELKEKSQQLERVVEEIKLERERAESALRRFEAVLTHAPMGISFIEAPSGKMVLMNQKAKDIIGHDTKMLNHFSEYAAMGAIHEDGTPYRADEYPTVRAFKKGETVVDEEMTYIKPDGNTAYLSLSASPIRDDNGNIVGAVGTFFDMTERNRLKHDLEEREENFRAIFTNAASGIARVGISGTWEIVNDRLTQILQYSEEELVGKKTFLEMTHPDDQPKETHLMQMVLAGESDSFTMEKRFQRKDGTYVWVNVTKSLVRENDGTPKYLISVIEDISERKKLQRELERAREEAVAANASKSAFLANMSHEIRTPMTAVLGFTEILKDQSLTREERIDAISRIDKSGRALIRLIDDILDISKIEAGRLEISKSKFSTIELVSDVTSFMRITAEKKGINLKLKIDKDVPDLVMSDPVRIRQILTNVIGNAIKFTSVGEVCIHVKMENSTRLVFRVTDTGIGISKENMTKLFQPFSQADESITRRFGGTGLGLVLSRKLAERLGGELYIEESLVGKGTTFVASVQATPIHLQENTHHHPPLHPTHDVPDQAIDLSGKHILIAEDVKDNQMLLKMYLRNTGARLVFADNGEDALQLAEDNEFDLILMDIQMPVLDGIQATKKLRAAGFSKPIVALTAHAMTEEVNKSLNAGCNAHLTKPITKAALVQAIQDYT